MAARRKVVEIVGGGGGECRATLDPCPLEPPSLASLLFAPVPRSYCPCCPRCDNGVLAMRAGGGLRRCIALPAGGGDAHFSVPPASTRGPR